MLRIKKLFVHNSIEKLSAKTIIQEKFKYILWIDGSNNQYVHKPFYGTVNDSGFKVVQVKIGRNLFTPVICGVIKESQQGQFLEILIRSSPYIKAAFNLFLLSIIGILVSFIYTKDNNCLPVIMIYLLIFFIFLSLIPFKKSARRNLYNIF